MFLPHPKAQLRRASFRRLASRHLAAALLALGLAPAAMAQLFANPDWKESPVPPAPAFDHRRMLAIDMPRTLDLSFGVDPATIVVTDDGVVRYVLIAKNTGPSGAVNAFYEGIRCATGEGKIYARFSGDAWHDVENAEWKPLDQPRTRYSLALARQAICRSGAPRQTAEEMVRALRKPTYVD
jgi:hypothetical protein